CCRGLWRPPREISQPGHVHQGRRTFPDRFPSPLWIDHPEQGHAMNRLQDKVAIITGGSGGIGKATAARFLAEGALLMLVDIDDAGLEATRRELAGGDRVRAQRADVRHEEDVETYVQST